MIQMEDPADDQQVRRDRLEFIDEQRARINVALKDFSERREQFIAAAARVAGAKLATTRRRWPRRRELSPPSRDAPTTLDRPGR